MRWVVWVSLLDLNTRLLWSRRSSWCVAFFVFGLLVTCMGFAGWLSDIHHATHAAWLCLIIFGYATFFLETSDDQPRLEWFEVRSLGGIYLATKGLVIAWMGVPIIAFWAVIQVLLGLELRTVLYIAATAWLFLVVFLATVLLTHRLMARFHLAPMVQILISGPWVLVAWLLGLGATEAWLEGASGVWGWIGLLAMVALQAAGAWFCQQTAEDEDEREEYCEAPKGRGKDIRGHEEQAQIGSKTKGPVLP